MKKRPSVLLLYDRDYEQAATVMDHVASFKDFSSFDVTALNGHAIWKRDEQGCSDFEERAEVDLETIRGNDWDAVVLHYTLFGMDLYYLGRSILDWLNTSRSFKISFFQDEYTGCQRRFAFLNDYGVDCVYTLVEPRFFRETYLEYTNVPIVEYNLPGYVSDYMLTQATQILNQNVKRDIAVGYRGRRIPLRYGIAFQEKHNVGLKFQCLTADRSLRLDIDTTEKGRIYGQDWYLFNARCRAVLGVESGTTLLDVEDRVRQGLERLEKESPGQDERAAYEAVVLPHDHNMFYRTISPRHFEAAALGTCQILFEGKYSGLMDPMVHYIPLKKDFSNLEEVLRLLEDKDFCAEIAANARRDLIDSGRYHYREFIHGFDRMLLLAGVA